MDELQLYHYTTLQGALGIIENRKIWATHINYLNDPLEFDIGFTICIEIINELFYEFLNSDADNYKKVSVHLKYLLNTLSEFLGAKNKDYLVEKCKKYINDFEHARGYKDAESLINWHSELSRPYTDWYDINYFESVNLFTVSFSKSCDKLRHWVPYADNAKGIMLKFNDRVLSKIYYDGINNIGEVKYLSNRNNSKYNELKEEFKSEICKKINRYQSIVIELFDYIIKKSIFIKSSDYEDENEYRVIVTENILIDEYDEVERNKSIKYRVSNNRLIPYCEIGFTTEALDEIILGSNCNFESNQHAFRLLLKSNNYKYENVKIEQSKIRYR